MEGERHWWFCLKHNTVEPDTACRAKDRLRLVPETREEAAHALETVRQRNEEWDAAGDD